jgi:hypothetical protein
MTPTQDDPDTDRTEYTQEDFAIGDTVVDREQDDSEHVAVVVNRPPMAAEDWEAYRVDGEAVTVADDNPDYDPTANVVVVIYPEDLEEWGIEWDGDDPIVLADAPTGIAYAFPPGRLEPVGTYSPKANNTPNEAEATGTDEDLPADTETTGSVPDGSDTTDAGTADGADGRSNSHERLEAIANIVEELNVDDVTVDSLEEVVVVEKLGEAYAIDTDGSVDADDLLAQRLDDAVSEQLD